MSEPDRLLLSGNEAVALAARDGRRHSGHGVSRNALHGNSGEPFPSLGGRAQWAPNEKVALEVGLGVAYTNARALVTMKHVGLNVAADPLFTAAYTGVTGALVVVSADDPGMASSQNEQDNRRYAVAAGVPMLEPADSQEAYDFTLLALRGLRTMGNSGAPSPHDPRVPLQDRRSPGGKPRRPRTPRQRSSATLKAG